MKPAITLSGSCSKGLDTENSDIDLVVISENTKDFQKKSLFSEL